MAAVASLETCLNKSVPNWVVRSAVSPVDNTKFLWVSLEYLLQALLLKLLSFLMSPSGFKYSGVVFKFVIKK